MIVQDRITRAIEIAAQVHAGQTCKTNEPYILHPLALMNMVAPDEELMVLAILHDVLEDTDRRGVSKLHLHHVIESNFGTDTYQDLLILTHEKGEPYVDYIERVAQKYTTRKVKIADLMHNMDPRRIPAGQIVDRDFQRWDKYRKALIRLERDD